ncbi:MAG: DUF4349 domain-containing protein [Lachnospiraceae bacterium]|nr:DUF4349 domain-containing protein [Lachnospiraceae bacterium]
MKKIMKKQVIACIMLVALIFGMTGCNSYTSDSVAGETTQSYYSNEKYENSYAADDYYDMDGGYDMITEETVESEAPMSDSGSGADVTTNRKLIRTVSMDVETEEFETMIVNVEDKVNALGGYIESAYTYNGSAYNGSGRRYAEMTVRVPDADLDHFVDQVAGFSNVVSKTTNTQDITLEYVDTEGLKEMYIAEETSLLALLEKAETVEDITYLTTRLSEVRYNIENLESRLLKYDDLVEYATIHLYIEEVEVYTPVVTEEKTFGEEVKEGFIASVQDIWNSIVRLVKNLIIDSPYIIRFFVIVGLFILAIRLIIVIIKKAVKKKKAKRAAVKQENSEKQQKNETEKKPE